VAPFYGGSPILGYRLLIRQADGSFSEDMLNCDGAKFTIFTQTACTVPLKTLYIAPYNLKQGMGVYAKVFAYNYYGDSPSESN